MSVVDRRGRRDVERLFLWRNRCRAFIPGVMSPMMSPRMPARGMVGIIYCVMFDAVIAVRVKAAHRPCSGALVPVFLPSDRMVMLDRIASRAVHTGVLNPSPGSGKPG